MPGVHLVHFLHQGKLLSSRFSHVRDIDLSKSNWNLTVEIQTSPSLSVTGFVC